MRSWLGEKLRTLAQRIDPQDPEMLTVRDLRKPLSPDAQNYMAAKMQRAWGLGETIV